MADKEVLDAFIWGNHLNRRNKISAITAKDLSSLKSAGYSVEDLLDRLTGHYQSLLHGSREDIPGDLLLPNGAGKVYGSDLASIAIMRAIISNRGLEHPGLQYPYFIDDMHPLQVSIHGRTDSTIGNNGFVYIVNSREGFENYPQGSWQYVKDGEGVQIAAKLEVVKADFTYPIFDIT